jgi:hypothetical protein
MGVIPRSIGELIGQYPRRDVKDPSKYKYVEQAMKQLGSGTPCCVQISHALNRCNIGLPGSTYRRPASSMPKVMVDRRAFTYIPATDELEVILQDLFGPPETINRDLDKPRSSATTNRGIKNDLAAYIKDRPGLIIFRFSKYRNPAPPGEFEHTEFWDGKATVQTDMALDFLFARPRVLFWDSNDPAKFLIDYMKTQP